MIRVLQVLPALNFCGGIESYLMNYYRRLDKDKVQFDFITHTDLECSYREEVLGMGGEIFELPIFSGAKLPELLQRIKDFFQKNASKYQAVHVHMANAAPFYFYYAPKYGIKNLILHSHQPRGADKLSHRIRNYPLLKMANLMASHRVACTELAGKFLFGNKQFSVIRNAIDTKRFAFSPEKREELRRQRGWEENFVIGCVGRFTAQKNQQFSVEVFEALHQEKQAARLVFIGEGEDRPYIEELVRKKGLQDEVEFLGTCKSVSEFYQAFDVFLMPSLYEGLGIVMVEAQCAGLPVLASRDNVPDDVRMTENFQFMSLAEAPQAWAQKMLQIDVSTRRDMSEAIRGHRYDIDQEASFLQEYYQGMCDGYRG